MTSAYASLVMLNNRITYLILLIIGILFIVALFTLQTPPNPNYGMGVNTSMMLIPLLNIFFVYGLFITIMTFLRLRAIGRSKISVVIPGIVAGISLFFAVTGNHYGALPSFLEQTAVLLSFILTPVIYAIVVGFYPSADKAM